MAVTIKQIAKETNLSAPTVSQILSGSKAHLYAPKTRQRVLEVARALGYRPSPIARALRGARTYAIGYLVPDLSIQVQVEIMANVDRDLRKRGYRMLTGCCWRNAQIARNHFKDMLGYRVDGLLLASPSYYLTASDLSSLLPAGLPAVCIGHLEGHDGPSVLVDRRAGGEAVARHALELGHRSVAYVGSTLTNNRQVQERVSGFRDQLAEAGVELKPDRIIEGIGELEEAIAVAPRLLAMRPRPTFIFGSNDVVAVGVMRGLIRQGLRVPQDVSVVGFDGLDIGKYSEVRLTTITQHRQEQAQHAVDLLLSWIEDGSPRQGSIVLEPQLTVGESTGPVPLNHSS
ncbi:MAG TPA: LacI family DNA-binding transcriptional regulator [Phycisphaeraceae bacterium]